MQRLDVGYKKQREAYRLMTKAAQVKTRFDMEFTRQQGLMHSRYLDLRQEVTRTLHQQKSRNLDALIALRSQWALQSPSISVAQSEDETQATYTLTLIDRAITQNNESSSSFDFPDFETLIQSAHIALDNFHKKIEEQQQEARETWSDCQQENMRRRKAHRNDKSYSAVDPDELKSALSFFGIQGNTPRPAIRKRYRRLAMKYHPDKSNKENNEEMMKTLNRHYEVLKLHFDLHKD
ncbi:Chaperone protein DnaJ [Parendozoicomonas haliclonae]|uniref:Chaperone protein DnaJ n=2 Tax=Parendozoicomonas haliclonae TaxID=1960125 RepID=A0A1X7AMS1_9GAMM|nr:chaperone protein DnaJ [Parendozoicomonas haliclonae]